MTVLRDEEEESTFLSWQARIDDNDDVINGLPIHLSLWRKFTILCLIIGDPLEKVFCIGIEGNRSVYKFTSKIISATSLHWEP